MTRECITRSTRSTTWLPSLMLVVYSKQSSWDIPWALIIFGSGPGFAKAKAREGWNANADKLASKYASKGLDALIGSDRNKGHTDHGARVGLAHSAKNVFGQRDYDPLYVRMQDGASVAALHLSDLKLPVLIIIGDRDKQFRGASEMMKSKLPNAKMILVSNAGHMANENQPESFNRHVAEFIELLKSTSKL